MRFDRLGIAYERVVITLHASWYFVVAILKDLPYLIVLSITKSNAALGRLPNGNRVDYVGISVFLGCAVYFSATKQLASGVAFLIATSPMVVCEYFIYPIRSRGSTLMSREDWWRGIELSLKITTVGSIGIALGALTQEISPDKDAALATATVLAVAEWTFLVELMLLYAQYRESLKFRSTRLSSKPQDQPRTLRQIHRRSRINRSSYVRGPYHVAGSQKPRRYFTGRFN